MHRLLIVEDVTEDASVLMRHIERFSRETGEQFEVTLRPSAVDLDPDAEFDLVFMDVGLPGISGLEATEGLRSFDSSTPLILMSTEPAHAVHGYEVGALDFLVKPVAYQAFRPRMQKALRHIAGQGNHSIAFGTRDDRRVVPAKAVVYVEVANHNLLFHLDGESEPSVARGTLAALESELAGGSFVRVSSSHLANMAHIVAVRRDSVEMTSGDVLYFSRPRRKAAIQRITDYLCASE